MRSVNRVTLLGQIGRDAETTPTKNSSVTKFSMATTRRFKSGDEWTEETDWHNIVLWNADNLAQYLTKGAPVYIEGRIQTRSYDAKDGSKRYATDIVAENVILLGKGDNPDRPAKPVAKPAAKPAPKKAPLPPPAQPPQYTAPIGDDDIPF